MKTITSQCNGTLISNDLKKSVDAIYAYPMTGKLTLLARKVFNILLANAMQTDAEPEFYEIRIVDLAKDADYDSNDMSTLLDTLDDMQRTLLRWSVQERVGDRCVPVEIRAQLIGTVNIVGGAVSPGERTNVAKVLRYKFDDQVKQRLLVPEVYARINLQLQKKFRSAFSIALYEQIIRYKNNIASDGWSYTTKLPWRSWRNLIVGMESPDSYEQYKYFCRDVIVKSLKELNKVVKDYEIEYLAFKEGKSVKDIQFRIRQTAQVPLKLEQPNPLIDFGSIRARLKGFGFSKPEIDKLVGTYELITLEDAAEQTDARMRRNDLNPIRSKSAYFMTALNRLNELETTVAQDEINGAPKYKSDTSPSAHKITATQAVRPPQPVSSGAEAGTWEETEAVFLELPETVRNEIVSEFIDRVNNPAVIAAYAKSGLKSGMVRAVFKPWFDEHISRDEIFPGKGLTD